MEIKNRLSKVEEDRNRDKFRQMKEARRVAEVESKKDNPETSMDLGSGTGACGSGLGMSGAMSSTMRSDFAKELEINLKNCAAEDFLDKKRVKLDKKKDKVRNFGNDSSDSSAPNSLNNSREENPTPVPAAWTGVVNRRATNLQKKDDQDKKKRGKEKETVDKSKNIVGIGPIPKATIDFFMAKTNNYKQAKIEACKEFLVCYLDYTPEELENAGVCDAREASSGDVLNCVFKDEEQAKETFRRKAEIKNSDLTIRMYVPPQLFERFRSLNDLAASLRKEDDQLKTQVRYAKSDFQLWGKRRRRSGSESEKFEGFKPLDLEQILQERKMQLPLFDHSIKWHSDTSMPPRRKLSETRISSSVPPSLQNLQNLVRCRSSGSQDKGERSKRSRQIVDEKEMVVLDNSSE